MEKERPLWHRLYFDPVYVAVAREIGYQGCLVRDMYEKIEVLAKTFDKKAVESALYHLVTFEGQMTVNPKPLARVTLREETRKLCWQLLGAPPEQWNEFYRHPNGEPNSMHAAKMVELAAMTGGEKKSAKKPRKKSVHGHKPHAEKGNAGPQKQAMADASAGCSQPETNDRRTAPLMQQYREAKERHPGMLLLFRMGDFYELFEDHAETAAKLLGLTITSRAKIPMAGFPHHALESNLRKLLHAGNRVAICDQVEEAPPNSEVDRVVT